MQKKNNHEGYFIIYLFVIASIVLVGELYFFDLLSTYNRLHTYSGDSHEYFSAADLLFSEFRGHPTRPVGFPILLKLISFFSDGKFNYTIFFTSQVAFWYATIALIYLTVRLFKTEKIAFIGGLIFISCVGFSMRFLQIMTEPFYTFLLTFSIWLLFSGYQNQKAFRILCAWFLVCFSVIVRPSLFFSIIILLPLICLSFYKIKNYIYIFLSISIAVFLIGGQAILTYKSTKVVKLSFIGEITLYLYHDAYLQALKDSKSIAQSDILWGKVREKRKVEIGLVPVENYSTGLLKKEDWLLTSRKIKSTFFENVWESPVLATINYFQILFRNSVGGSDNLINIKNNYTKLTYFAFLLSRLQNLVLTIFCFLFFLKVIIDWKKYVNPIWQIRFALMIILMNIILLSPVSLAQGDRLHVVFYPIIIIIMCLDVNLSSKLTDKK